MDYVDFVEGLYFYFVKYQNRSNSANCSAEYDDVCRKLSDLHLASLFRGHETVSVRVVKKFPFNFWALNLRVIIFQLIYPLNCIFKKSFSLDFLVLLGFCSMFKVRDAI